MASFVTYFGRCVSFTKTNPVFKFHVNNGFGSAFITNFVYLEDTNAKTN